MPVSHVLKMSALDDLASLKASLRAEGLPHADLDEPGREFFQFQIGEQWVGYVGVEGSTADRLLRSFIVSPSSRGEGIGSQALALLEALLVSRGVRTLHLLTTTAAPFFEYHGFEQCSRAEAPSVVQDSLEFRSLCPANASYMAKRIA
ncbi:arsenic resistance N-acetyltransferase ArsN2 [Pseudomonas sp. RGM2987]|uniref:arsenic resistance N-acetyltransferase ArsN2 n=1 Tax=Pseudomonas sp. RGM2987 TaxID=2930090 RepID=UPI001FD6A0B0|nr:arsenic resistance N-acetyltransferase ArsN2 [Pseudomonas sp. RGM2987]MCJ8207354.1 arsenic resistance N-acetyltransferase ArsN2 [Pseudomonas sp. RGM2987]